MYLIQILILLFSNLFFIHISASRAGLIRRLRTRKFNNDYDECVCFPGGQSLIPELLNPQGLERLVIYLYKDVNTNEIKMFTPSPEKQALIPNIPFGVGDRLKTVTTETVSSLFPNNNNIQTTDQDQAIPGSGPIGLNIGTIETIKPKSEFENVQQDFLSENNGYPEHKIEGFPNQSYLRPNNWSPNLEYTTESNGIFITKTERYTWQPQNKFNSHQQKGQGKPNQHQQHHDSSVKVRPSKPSQKDIYAPGQVLNKDYLTFDQWFNHQINSFTEINLPQDIKSVNIEILKSLVQKTLFENHMHIGSTGLIADANGTPINLDHLELRPILIGNSVTYKQALHENNKLTLPKNLPYLEGILITLVYPPKVLGIIPLGKTFVSPRPSARIEHFTNFESKPNRVSSSSLLNSFTDVNSSPNAYRNWNSKYQPPTSSINLSPKLTATWSPGNSASIYSSINLTPNSRDYPYDNTFLDPRFNNSGTHIPKLLSQPIRNTDDFHDIRPSLGNKQLKPYTWSNIPHSTSEKHISQMENNFDSPLSSEWEFQESTHSGNHFKPNSNGKSREKQLLITPVTTFSSSSDVYPGQQDGKPHPIVNAISKLYAPLSSKGNLDIHIIPQLAIATLSNKLDSIKSYLNPSLHLEPSISWKSNVGVALSPHDSSISKLDRESVPHLLSLPKSAINWIPSSGYNRRSNIGQDGVDSSWTSQPSQPDHSNYNWVPPSSSEWGSSSDQNTFNTNQKLPSKVAYSNSDWISPSGSQLESSLSPDMMHSDWGLQPTVTSSAHLNTNWNPSTSSEWGASSSLPNEWGASSGHSVWESLPQFGNPPLTSSDSNNNWNSPYGSKRRSSFGPGERGPDLEPQRLVVSPVHSNINWVSPTSSEWGTNSSIYNLNSDRQSQPKLISHPLSGPDSNPNWIYSVQTKLKNNPDFVVSKLHSANSKARITTKLPWPTFKTLLRSEIVTTTSKPVKQSTNSLKQASESQSSTTEKRLPSTTSAVKPEPEIDIELKSHDPDYPFVTENSELENENADNENNKNEIETGPTRRFPTSFQGVIKSIINLVLQNLSQGDQRRKESEPSGTVVANPIGKTGTAQNNDGPDFRIIGGIAATGSGVPLSNKGRSGINVL